MDHDYDDPRLHDDDEDDEMVAAAPPTIVATPPTGAPDILGPNFEIVQIQDNPMVRMAAGGVKMKPFVPEVDIRGAGPRNIPRKKNMTESEYLEIYYDDDDTLNRYVQQTNLKVFSRLMQKGEGKGKGHGQ